MPKTILLADDSLTIQKVAELSFAGSGYELVCVSNGQKALEKIAAEKPDLILADVVMPEKNGYEVCEAVKSNPATARIPVVLLSGAFEPFDRERAERIGCDAIVSKPFDAQKLLAQVGEILARATPGEAEPFEAAAAGPPEPFEIVFADDPGRFETAAAAPETEPRVIAISAQEAEVLFDVPAEEEPAPAPAQTETPAPAPAQASLEPDAPAAAAQGALTDEQIEMVARRVVEKLSEKVVREIAWEIVPDMAEIVIKKRIKELESGME